MSILEASHLSAGYERDIVLEDISFSLEEGTFVTVLGRNGSGKSTLIKALQALIKNSSGRVLLDGQDVLALKPRQIAKTISYVPQIFDFPFEFDVEEIVHMGRYIHQGRLSGSSSADIRIIDEVMDLTHVAPLSKSLISTPLNR